MDGRPCRNCTVDAFAAQTIAFWQTGWHHSGSFPSAVVALAIVAAVGGQISASEPTVEQGTTSFVPTEAESQVAERFRLSAHSFPWQAQHVATTDHIEVWDVTFPSPVVTPEPLNNTVHCEYYRPRVAGERPGVIVLHILGGDFPLSRLFCNVLAQHGVAALFVKMPYYGPRRTPGSARRMVSTDPAATVEGMTQAVLDIRRATAWLAARPEVADDELGIFGISLGGITSSLAASAEPRLKNVCLLLAGGDVGQIAWDSLELRGVREQWLSQGKSREEFLATLREVDPVTYARAIQDRRVLMLNARDDEVIPRACTESLWRALGEPPIEWYSGGHYTVIRHLARALMKVGHFFSQPAAE